MLTMIYHYYKFSSFSYLSNWLILFKLLKLG